MYLQRKIVIIFFSFFFLKLSLYGTSGDWNVDADGNWSDGANWTSDPAFPNGIADVAGFPAVTTETRTVTVDGTFDLLTLDFSNNFLFVLQGGRLNLYGNFDATGDADISSTLNFVNNISSEITRVAVNVSGQIIGPGGISLITNGTLNYLGTSANTYAGLTTITDGTLSLGKTAGVNAIAGNILVNGGTLELANANQIANTSAMTLSSGIFDMGNHAETLSSLVFSGGTVDNNGSSLSLQSTGTALTMGDGTSLLGQLNLTGASGGTVVYNGSTTAATLAAVNLGSATRIFNIASGTADPDMSVTGAITGSGSAGLIKNGNGTLSLSGANTYPGSTTINAGVLRLDGATATLGAGALIVNGGSFEVAGGSGTKTIETLDGSSTINLNNTTLNIGSGSFSGTITGTGDINKIGTETLTLSGTTTLTGGDFNVEDGTLLLTGTLTADTVNVGEVVFLEAPILAVGPPSGPTLAGNGFIFGNVIIYNGAIMSPRASIGTLTINGNYTQSGGSFLLNQIDDDGNSDLVRVIGGVATIEAGAILVVDPAPGVYLPGTIYTIIDTDAPIVGAFDTIQFTADGLQVLAAQDSDLFLTLAVGGFINTEALVTGNAQKAARCLDTQSILSGSDLEIVGRALQPLTNSPSSLQNAYDQMQPAIFGALNLIEESQAILVQSTMSHRIDAWGNGRCGDLEPNAWNFWIKPVGEFIDQHSSGQNVGYSSDAYGGVFGADRKLADYFHLGAAAGYVYNNVHFKRSRGKVHANNIYGAFYAFWQQECFHILASVIGAWNDYHGFRQIKFTTLNRRAEHDNHGYIVGAQFETAYSINRKNTRVQPFGRAQYIYSTQGSYQEHGAGVLDLKVERKSSDRFRSNLGLDFSQCYKIGCGQIVPNIYVSWAWEKELKSGHMRATFIDFDCEMSVHAYRPVRSLFAPGAGLTGVFCGDRISVALKWDGEFGKRYSNQKALVEANFGF